MLEKVLSMKTPHLSPNSYPLALLAAACATGILLARLTPLTLAHALSFGALCTKLAVVAFRRRKLQPATMFVALACLGAGASLARVEGARGIAATSIRRLFEEGQMAAGDPVEATGVIERAPEVAPDGLYLALRVESVRLKNTERAASGTVSLFAPVRDAGAQARYDELELRRGGRVRVLTTLAREERFRNPGGSSLTEFLERQGVEASGMLKSPLLMERLNDERVLLPLVWLEEWREVLRARMAAQFNAETAGILQAALLGNRYGLSRTGAERFREGGTFHVLVISGLHISFIGGAGLLLVRRMTRRRAAQFAVVVASLWAYTLAVGAEASVVRAALMFTLMALAPVIARRGATLNALGGTALALLVVRPSYLFDPSFQLTFLSVVGIVALGWPLIENLRAVGAWHPTRATPHPPVCPRWWRLLGETLFWSERAWRREMERNVYSYRLFKTEAAGRLERWRVQRAARYAVGALIVSASVQLTLLPLLVLYFHRVSLSAVVLNIFVGVLMAASSLAALAALIVGTLGARLATPLVWFVEQASWLMAHSVDPFAGLHAASLRLPEYTGRMAAVYGLYYLPLAVLTISLARWRPLQPDASSDDKWNHTGVRVRRLAWAGLMFALFVIIAHPRSAGRADGRLRLDFLDVGQGDAALLTFPDGTTLLVDGGGRPDFKPRRSVIERGVESETEEFERDTRGVGESVVSEYLWWRGLDRVDYLLATHAHADHMQGLNDVARNFKVRAALVGRAQAGEAEFARLAATLRREQIPFLLIGRGDSFSFGGATVEVLWPPRVGETHVALSENNDSLVLRVRYGARAFLLTGDVEREGEASLVAAGDDLLSDVVKVAHHGSQTSSTGTFVVAAHPAFAVISVGQTSPFGHPDTQVVERWRAAGAEVLQTGRRGTITVSTDGRDLKVETLVRE